MFSIILACKLTGLKNQNTNMRNHLLSFYLLNKQILIYFNADSENETTPEEQRSNPERCRKCRKQRRRLRKSPTSRSNRVDQKRPSELAQSTQRKVAVFRWSLRQNAGQRKSAFARQRFRRKSSRK